MACVTLKRPLEWIDPSMSPESGSSSPTHMNISNSPPHHGLRSPKRLCLQSISQSTSFQKDNFTFGNGSNHSSSFINNNSSPSNSQKNYGSSSNNIPFKTMSSSEIADQIREEMICLRIFRRSKTKLSESQQQSCSSNLINTDGKSSSSAATSSNNSGSIMESSMGSSPSSSPSRQDGVDGSDSSTKQQCCSTVKPSSISASTSTSSSSSSYAYNLYTSSLIGGGGDGENNYHNLVGHHLGKNYNFLSSSNSNKKLLDVDVSNKSKSLSTINHNDQPLFTFNQVVMIVESILRDHDESVRHEFEQVLAQRLGEQYEQFVKFSYDQIQRRFDSRALPSYLS